VLTDEVRAIAAVSGAAVLAAAADRLSGSFDQAKPAEPWYPLSERSSRSLGSSRQASPTVDRAEGDRAEVDVSDTAADALVTRAVSGGAVAGHLA